MFELLGTLIGFFLRPRFSGSPNLLRDLFRLHVHWHQMPIVLRAVFQEGVRTGSAEIFREVGPLRGRRHVTITEHRARKDGFLLVKGMVDERHPPATKVRWVMNKLFS
jgi:hypothetical protein